MSESETTNFFDSKRCKKTKRNQSSYNENKMVESEAISFPNEEEFMEEAEVNNDFPSEAEFAKEEENPIPWRDVECNIPFKVLEMNEISTINGNALIVKMQKRDNTVIKAWTTNIIKENLLKKQKFNRTKNIYIMSRGKKIAQKSKNSYYNFKIICK